MPKCAFFARFLLKMKKKTKTFQMKSKYFENFQNLTLDYLECFPKRIFEKEFFFQKIWQKALCRQEKRMNFH